MKFNNYEHMMYALNQLASKDEQIRLWANPNKWGSYIEAVEVFYGDSYLSDMLKTNTTGLAPETDAVLIELEKKIDQVDDCYTLEMIEKPIMEEIRQLAAKAYKLLEPLNPNPDEPNPYYEL